MKYKSLNRGLLGCMVLVGLVGMSACKPTEKNYRAAYDVAQKKRTSESAQLDSLRKSMNLEGMGEEGFSDVDGVAFEQLSPSMSALPVVHVAFPADSGLRGYSLAVARFKMSSNARAMAEDILSQGWPSSVAVKGGEYHYVVTGNADNPESIAALMDQWQRQFPRFSYVGFPYSCPVIIVN